MTSLTALAADYPRAETGRLDRHGLQIPHRRDNAGTAASLHHHRRADRPAGAGAAWFGRLGGQHADAGFRGELFGAGQPLDASKYYIIIPDGLGHGRSSKPSDAMKTAFPKYDYDDMVDAQYRLIKEGLGIKHLRLVIGNSMGGMHAWIWGVRYPQMMDALVPMASQPTEMAARNWMRGG